jgi:hypothetical protein
MPRRNAIPRSARQAEARERALAALALMRRKPGTSLPRAASEYHTTPRTVHRYVGTALKQARKGSRYTAAAYDRLPRRLNAIISQGPEVVLVRDSRTATKISEHSNAARVYRNTGDTTALEKFRGKSFRASGKTYEFVTDPVILDRLEDADLFPENFYQLPVGAGV